eukprot:6193708-Pyramimonas_sp.AAC.1
MPPNTPTSEPERTCQVFISDALGSVPICGLCVGCDDLNVCVCCCDPTCAGIGDCCSDFAQVCGSGDSAAQRSRSAGGGGSLSEGAHIAPVLGALSDSEFILFQRMGIRARPGPSGEA